MQTKNINFPLFELGDERFGIGLQKLDICVKDKKWEPLLNFILKNAKYTLSHLSYERLFDDALSSHLQHLAGSKSLKHLSLRGGGKPEQSTLAVITSLFLESLETGRADIVEAA